ncbi:alpha/beta hydrolase [Oceanirhabdus sp. W0125-5]|uniref:alpha/beta hydrolase n=1 Tax=Oceanirhabdus sp. W0125-5 TaxID=2999116 RepID=UPI0022F334C1|nr:alpha/beta hydrolase [Oceanirhabdus sp. W0125-5]WBW97382.1 alpha/beta hydrolase [Oceanirhabdus sp. W0125-5]
MVIFVLSCLFIAILGVIFTLRKFYLETINRKIKDMNAIEKGELEKGLIDRDFLDKLQQEKVYINSIDGFKLSGVFIRGNQNKDKTILVSHGITSGIPASYKYARPFIERGWNVLLIYHRRHIESEGKYSTMGYYEKHDLLSWIEFIKEKVVDNNTIGIHGESMGASSALLTANMTNEIDFIIADCGFSRFHDLLVYKLKISKIPVFPLMNITYSYTKLKAKFNVKDVNPIEAIKESGIPVLFIHGKEDKFVPTFMSEDMYKETKGYKEIYLVPNAAHAQSIFVDYETYKNKMMNFVDKVLAQKKDKQGV